MAKQNDEHESVTRFRQFLRINTMQPDPDYESAFEYLQVQADDIGLPFQVVHLGEHKSGRKYQVALMTWEGTQPDLQSILLMSHLDVVPVFEEHWKYGPFDAHKDEQGNIFARGSQDMKCVSMWYLEAIRRLKRSGKRFKRTVHLLFTTDEEVNTSSAPVFLKTPMFKQLNVAFGLDEGIANPGPEMFVFYGERSLWWVDVVCEGAPGHGSSFIQDTAGCKLNYMLNKFHQWRDEQEQRLKDNADLTLGSVITINLTRLRGGVQPNVIPSQLSATFDIRVPPTEDQEALKQKMFRWAEEAGPNVNIVFICMTNSVEMVRLDDSNRYWKAFQEACQQSNVQIKTEIFPAGTDGANVRKAGVDVLGFSPMNNTPVLLHDHNEHLNQDVFLRGIDLYCNVINALANVSD